MLWLALLSFSEAHVGATLEGIDVVFPGPSLDANFGLLVSDDGESFSWLCHEAITAEGAVISPRYARDREGVWLVTVPALAQARDPGEPVYRTTDLCDWWPVDGLEDRTVSRVAFSPQDDSLAFALTADLGEGLYNGVFRSVDGGQTFTAAAGGGGTERLLRTLVFDPLRPGQLWASAVWYEDGGSAWLYHSTDSGETWQELPVPLPADSGEVRYDVDVIAAHDGVLWLVMGPYGDDVLLRSDDGGQTFTTALSAEGDLIDGGVDGEGNIWLPASGQRLYASLDGGESFALYTPAPGGIGAGVDEAGTVWATGFAQFTGQALYRRAPGAADFALTFLLADLQPPPATCPAESHVATACSPLWEGLAARIPQPFVDTGDPAEDTDPDAGDSGAAGDTPCGCGAQTAASGVLLLGPLLWMRRRRSV